MPFKARGSGNYESPCKLNCGLLSDVSSSATSSQAVVDKQRDAGWWRHLACHCKTA